MDYTYKRAGFTMIELVFVIVVIGILAAIALPRFSGTADIAYLTKAQSTLATVQSALATERQKRILRGDTATAIVDLGLSSSGTSTTNAFDHFSADKDGNYAEVLRNPVRACSNASQRACWDRRDATHYWFRFPDASDATDGVAKFILENNRLNCDNDAADCRKISQ